MTGQREHRHFSSEAAHADRGSEQARAVRHGPIGREEYDRAVLIREADSQHLRHELADLPGRKIDDCRNLPADQLVRV